MVLFVICFAFLFLTLYEVGEIKVICRTDVDCYATRMGVCTHYCVESQ